jgi:hypothetical protein
MSIEEKYQMACKTPSDIFEHLPTLRKYASECQHVTELGVRTIISTWAFLAGLKDGVGNGGEGAAATFLRRGVAATLVSVDAIHPRDAGGDLGEVERLAAAEGIGFEFYLADDREITLPYTDLLFIDTWHVYDQLMTELDRHAGKARKFIILHDTETFGLTGEAPGHRGLKPALDEFLASYEGKCWKVREHFTNCNGLTVLERVESRKQKAEIE